MENQGVPIRGPCTDLVPDENLQVCHASRGAGIPGAETARPGEGVPQAVDVPLPSGVASADLKPPRFTKDQRRSLSLG